MDFKDKLNKQKQVLTESAQTSKKIGNVIIQNKVKRILAPWVIGTKFFVRQPEDTERKPSLLGELAGKAFTVESSILPNLLEETAEVLQFVTKASGVTLYKVDPRTSEIYLFTKNTSLLERQRVTWSIEEGKTVAAYVAKSKDYVLTTDIYTDKRFVGGLEYEDMTLKSIIAVPILTLNGDCYAVIELNRSYSEENFTNVELKIVMMVTGWMGAAIHQDWERETLQKHHELNAELLNLVHASFTGDKNFSIMEQLVKRANIALGAERGSLFVLDSEKREFVAEYMEGASGETWGKKAARFKQDTGIAGYVANTGKMLNVKDAYNDDRFNREIDEKTGYITRSILCSPVISENEGVIAVVQHMNKKTGGAFTISDELLCTTFTAYFTLALQRKLNLKKYKDLQIVNKWYLLMFKLHGRACIHDKLQTKEIFRNLLYPYNFHEFDFYADISDYPKIPAFILGMCTKIFSPSEIDINSMLKFILAVQKFHNNNSYHNFKHAFHSFHCLYLILGWNYRCFTSMEIKAMLIASLCRNLDHPGRTKYFLTISKDQLTILYPNFEKQRRSYYLAEMLVNNFNIFPKMTNFERTVFLEELKDNMLNIDSTIFHKIENEVRTLIIEDSFNWLNDKHRRYLKDIVLLSAEVADQCKNYSVSKTVAFLRFHEMYRSRPSIDKRLQLCNLTEIYSDRFHRIPKYQLKYLTYFVVPCIYILQMLLPNVMHFYYLTLISSEDWGKVLNDEGRKVWRPHDSIVQRT